MESYKTKDQDALMLARRETEIPISTEIPNLKSPSRRRSSCVAAPKLLRRRTGAGAGALCRPLRAAALLLRAAARKRSRTAPPDRICADGARVGRTNSSTHNLASRGAARVRRPVPESTADSTRRVGGSNGDDGAGRSYKHHPRRRPTAQQRLLRCELHDPSSATEIPLRRRSF